MILVRLALRNLLGAGVRTWLNALVLSIVFVGILTAQGLLEGMNQQTVRAVTEAEYGGGQYWHPAYDPHDPLSLRDAHGPLPEDLRVLTERARAAPILIVPGTIYPQGRLLPVLVKGIDPNQEVVTLPVHLLAGGGEAIPALIGARMARSSGLGAGDRVTLQWRDVHGTFDARDVEIVAVFDTPVQSIDSRQFWVPLALLQAMTEMPGEATLVVLDRQASPSEASAGWHFRSLEELLQDIRSLIQSKTVGSMFIYTLLVFLAMLAIFDTQVFSIFRRQREVGTLIALGMTGGQVRRLLTLEGALHGVLAGCLAALYGVPLLTYFAHRGWTLPETTDRYGFAVGDVLYPEFGPVLIAGTAGVILALTALVSYLPTRRLARVRACEALRGRVF